jgi:TonB family protein
MTTFINYMIEANVSLVLFLLCYWILLRDETNFTLKRFLLLGGIVLSIIFPLIHISHYQQNIFPAIGDAMPYNWLPEIIINGKNVTHKTTEAYDVWQIIALLYVTGVITFLCLTLIQIISLLALIKNSTTYKLQNFNVAESIEAKPTFSFFKFIYIGRAHELSTFEKQQIINHESVHAQQLHSLDILLLNFLKVIFWFNPFINNYKKIFIQLHEFEADARAVKNSDENKYCNLLARVALQSADFSIANHFNNSLTLKRIEMIRTIKKKISQWKIFAYAALVPLMFFLLACQDQVMAQQISPPVEKSQSNEVFETVDEVPIPPANYMDILSKEIHYPEKARKAKIEGTSFVSFIVEKDGATSEVKILKGFDPSCDAEALRVVKQIQNWTPGKQQGKAVRAKFVIPIKFKV